MRPPWLLKPCVRQRALLLNYKPQQSKPEVHKSAYPTLPLQTHGAYFLLHFPWGVHEGALSWPEHSNCQASKPSDNNRRPVRPQPSHPLPCPWSRAQHIPNPSPHARACSHALRLPSCTTRRPQSLLIKRQVSILPAERWLVKARARHRPQRPVSEINLSLFLFQSSSLQLLASLAMNLPEFVRQCWPTQPGAVLSSRPSPLGIPRTELLTRERTRASVRFLN